MANLTINIVTKYADAEKGFSKVAGSLTKYRNELLKANAEGKVTEQSWVNYRQALNNALIEQDLTRDGMAKLTAQARILGKEVSQIGMAFGEDNENYKAIKGSLSAVKEEMKGFDGEMGNLGKTSGNTGLKLLSVAKNILKFQLLMGPITAVVRGFRTTISDSVKVAAEAEQIFSKLSTVFDGFGDSARKAATQLASAIGVANSTAASALSTVGDLLQAQGMGTSESLSTASTWVKQFQDIIAFKDINMSLEEFAQNFMSGAAGNLRNFRTFGSIVKESAVNAELASKGLDKLTGSELELAKMVTRAEMALEQQKNAMGATEREWDTMLSVNRRYAEAQKQFKENLGDELNNILKPTKSALTEILEAWNGIVEARKRYESIKAGETVLTPEYDESDSSQRRLLEQMIIESRTAILQGYTPKYSMTGETVSRVSATTGATPKQILDAFEKMGNIDNSSYDRDAILKEAADNLAEIARKEEERARIENRLTKINSVTQSADSFMESIAAITGARGGMDIQDTSWLSTMKWNVNGESWVSSWIKEYVDSNIKGALESMDSADLNTFGDIISGELGDLNEGDLLKNKAEAYRQFFEAVHNYFGKDGEYSEDELETLEGIKKAYASVNEEAAIYQKRLEAESGIASSITSAQDVLWEASTKARLADTVPEDQMSVWIKYEKILEDLRKQFTELGKETIEVDGVIYDLRGAEELLIEARQKEIDATKKQEEELEKEVFSLSKRISEGMFGGKYKDTGFMQNFAGALAGSTGGQIIEAGIQGGAAGGPWGAILGVLMSILSHTESFSEILEMAEPVVEIFDSFIKPLVPAIKIITDITNEILYSVLRPLFPIIKLAAQLLAIISIPIKIASNIIKNIYVAVNNILQRLLHPFSGGNQMDYVSLTDGVSDILDSVRKIGEMTFDIRNNTDPANSELLKAYSNMFQKGMLTASEYQGLLADMNGLNYDRMKVYEGGSWNSGSGGTTVVYYGDLKFTINGTNLSAQEIAEAVTRKQKEWATTGQYYA